MRFADALFFFLLIAAPLAYGTVHTSAVLIFAVLAALLFILQINGAGVDPRNITGNLLKLPVFWIGLILACLGLAQLIPLPANILKAVSPSAFKLYSGYLMDYSLKLPWRPLSVYQWGTIFELIRIASYGAVFFFVYSRMRTHRTWVPAYQVTPGTVPAVPEETVNEPVLRNDKREKDLAYLKLGCVTGVLSLLFHSLYDFNMHTTANAFYFTVLLSLVCGSSGNGPYNKVFFRSVTNGIIYIGFCIAVFSFIQQLSYNGHIYWIGIKALNPRGPYVNYDHFAGFMELCTPLVIASLAGRIAHSGFFRKKGIAEKILWFSTPEANQAVRFLFFSVVMTASIFFSTSRGGIMSFLASQVIFILAVLFNIKKRHKARILIFLGAVMVLISIMVIWLGPESMLRRFKVIKITELMKMEGPIGERLSFWKDSAKVIRDYPIVGAGLGAYAQSFAKYRTFVIGNRPLLYAHNDYLQLVSEAGIFGALCILIFLLYFCLLFFRAARGIGK